MTKPYVERLYYWTQVEGEEEKVRGFALIPDGWEGKVEELPEDDFIYYWLDSDEWNEDHIGKTYGDALVLRSAEDEE